MKVAKNRKVPIIVLEKVMYGYVLLSQYYVVDKVCMANC